MVNNCVFGMTGGQMSPESLPGQKTTSSPFGRDININGHPFDVVKTLREYDIAILRAARSALLPTSSARRR